ncbi:kinase-like protein [Ceratobasidium sp. AG-I]|nr:kinase-like protein [Ceratobasidium sp. AG-I]
MEGGRLFSASELRSSQGNRSRDPEIALSYLKLVENTFQSQPEVNWMFLDVMQRFLNQSFDPPVVINYICGLFHKHAVLLEGFNIFLPSNYRIDCVVDSNNLNLIKVTTPSGSASRTSDLCASLISQTPIAPRGGPLSSYTAHPSDLVAQLLHRVSSIYVPVAPAPHIRRVPLPPHPPRQASRPVASTWRNPPSSRLGPFPGLIGSSPPKQSDSLPGVNDRQQTSLLPISTDTWSSSGSLHPPISSTMAASDIISYLTQHECQDISESVDFSTCSQHPISTGGFGEIYRVNLKNGSPAAIKCMRILVGEAEKQKYLKYAAREIHTWSKCKHRHVLTLLGLVLFRGQIGMVSPWITHGSLGHYLTRHPEADRLQLCEQVTDGLTYLHWCGIVHGDLKGANVLVSDDGDALLTDFGNAVLQERTLQFTYTTAKNHLSPRWTAPELIREEGTFSNEADVFALGMTMLEIITGAVPYHQLKEFGVMYAIAEGRLPKRPEDKLPTGSEAGDLLWSVLVRCWSFEPQARPTAHEVRHLVTPLKLVRRAAYY